MNILGISALYHDSAAVLVQDGQVTAATQEERFSRKRHDAGFPAQSIAYALRESGLSMSAIDHVVFYDKPLIKFERLLETYLAYAPRGYSSFKTAMPVWLKEKLFLKDLLMKELKKIDPAFDREKLLFSEHHLSHAASAFYPSPYEDAVVITMDGVGEWATGSMAVGRGKDLKIIKEMHFPHSLGLLYSAFTYYTGFKVNSGEYKVMGLAPYGQPKYVQQIYDNLIDVKPDGSFRLNMKYFDYCTGLTMTNQKFSDLFGHPVRGAEAKLEQFHMDLTASLQVVTEEVMIKLVRGAVKETGIRNVCLAGGVALNCVANGKIWRDGHADGLWIQPAAGDAGGALGGALAVYHLGHDKPRVRVKGERDGMKGSYLGPQYTQAQIEQELRECGAVFETLDEKEMIRRAAADLAAEKALGWFQGRMEFGPRSLGARSILGDARSPAMQKTLNLKVKFRESFRPFAPAVLAEEVGNWFEHQTESPYMLIVAGVLEQHRRQITAAEEALFGIEKLNVPKSSIPAITHVDYSARLQTVHADTNAPFHALITEFKRLTGTPVLVNTSFNVRGEPIVCSPKDAFRCFMGSDIEVLVVGNAYLVKPAQTVKREDYFTQFELD